jgi:hypothetical protein
MGNVFAVSNWDAVELDLSGSNSINISDSNSSGINSGGINSSGINSSGINSSGINSSGINSSGINSSGINSSGINSSGSNIVKYINNNDNVNITHETNGGENKTGGYRKNRR